jgi:D-2-hydroxyacid dehydrogenase (NADP+)
MTALLVSHELHAERGADLARRASEAGLDLELIALPAERETRLAQEACERIELGFFSGDVYPDFSRQFFSAVRKAPRLAWLHVFNVGVDHPIYHEMLERGVRITTSAGSTAVPIAHTAIAGMLMLARNFPHWLEAQRARRWAPLRASDAPRDLSGQTVLVLGLGHIGREFARISRALGLTVIGVRRSPARADEPVDELHPPERLPALLPRADWLVIACPLTAETRGLIGAEALSRLPAGARLINVARGEIVDEAALIAALATRRLSGAYLDVFEREPLARESPLWDMPGVIVTPHNSSAAAGNESRVYALFTENLVRWFRGEALMNEVARP